MIRVIINRSAICPISDALIKRCVNEASRLEPKIKGIVEISFVSRPAIKKINYTRRGIDAPTDVISFSWQEEKTFKTPYLGELYLSYQYIAAQAKRFNVSPREETIRMLTHGLLHLSGHDHDVEKAAHKMFKIQEAVVLKILK